MCGGYSAAKPADESMSEAMKPLEGAILDAIHEAARSFDDAVVAECAAACSSITPVTYKVQVVAGLNYTIKARIGNSDHYVHVTIWKRVGGAPDEVTKVVLGETADSQL